MIPLIQNPKSKIQHLLIFLIQNSKSKIQHLFNNKGFRRYAANTSWLFAEQMLRMIAGFFVGVWVARYLGPEKYGIFSYALAFVAIFQGIAKLGLDGIVVRDLVKEPEKTQVYLGTAFWLKLIGGFFSFLLILIISWFTADNLQTFLFVNIIAAGIFFQSFEVIDFYYQANVQAKYISIRKIAQVILSSIIKVYLILINADLIWFVLVTLFDAISLAIFSYAIYKKQGLPDFLRYFDVGLAKRLLKESWVMLFSSFFTLILLNINSIILKTIHGSYSVGIFYTALTISGLCTFVSVQINSSISPSLTSAKVKSDILYKERLLTLFKFLNLLSFLLSGAIFLTSDFIVRILYGEQYIESSHVLKILVWSNIFLFMGNSSWHWYLNERKQHLSILRLGIGALISLFLGLVLIKYFNVYGAALSTIISYAFAFYLGNFILSGTRSLFMLQTKAIFSFFNPKKYFEWRVK